MNFQIRNASNYGLPSSLKTRDYNSNTFHYKNLCFENNIES